MQFGDIKMKRWLKYLLFIILVQMIPIGLALEIYRCKKDRDVVYQNTPCNKTFNQTVIDNSLSPQTFTLVPIDPKYLEDLNKSSLTSKRLVIPRSIDGHYYIEGLVNGVTVNFMIDTGATAVAVSEEVAGKAGLIEEKEVYTNTAAGLYKQFTTTIEELKIEGIKFFDVNANIIQGSTSLLGMSILSEFEISQSNDQLILNHKR